MNHARLLDSFLHSTGEGPFLIALAAFAVTSVIAIIWVGLGARMVVDDIDSATGAGE